MENRSSILGTSLLIEYSISKFLSAILDISDSDLSISLSNKSSALSFRAKVNLLLDMKVFDKSDNWKLEKFMEIRNQFMHNFDASSFEKCFSFISGAQKKILEEYPQDVNLPIEEQLKLASQKLGNENLKLVQKVFFVAIERKASEAYQRGLSIFAQASKLVLDELDEKLSNDPDKISINNFWELLALKRAELEGNLEEKQPTESKVTFSQK